MDTPSAEGVPLAREDDAETAQRQRKGKVHEPRLRDDVGEDAGTCRLRHHSGQFRRDIQLKQRPDDTQSEYQFGGERTGLPRAGVGLCDHVFGGFHRVGHSVPRCHLMRKKRQHMLDALAFISSSADGDQSIRPSSL